MSDFRRRLGVFGENLAAEFLSRRGYVILARNFYTAAGEIDLIAEKGDEFLFCEVKTRATDFFGYPETSVNQQKIRHLLLAIQIYLHQHPTGNFWRIDIISVQINRQARRARLRWFQNINIDKF